MIDKQRILEALKFIKETCESINVGDCNKCPFSGLLGECLITNCMPAHWDIMID